MATKTSTRATDPARDELGRLRKGYSGNPSGSRALDPRLVRLLKLAREAGARITIEVDTAATASRSAV